jgi:hypothetical protein
MQTQKLYIFSFMAFAILSFFTLAIGTTFADTTITLEQAVHFNAADGSNILIQPGTYIVEAAEEWLRLVPGERRDALLLEAHQTQHDEILHSPIAMMNDNDGDNHRLVLLLPGGTGLEAIGSASVVRSRAVRHPLTSRTRTQQQAGRIPTQSKQSTIDQQSKPIPKVQSAPFNPLYLRVQSLEQQLNTLKDLVNALQGQLTTMTSAIQVDNAGNMTIGQAGTVTLQGNIVNINASSIDAQAATSKFSGVVQSDTLITNSVVSSSYTPGAGNIW